MGSPVSFVLSRMSTCAGTTKNRLTVPKRVWDFLTREHSIRLLRLTEETGVNLVVDAETPDAYVLQLLLPPHTPPGRLYPVRKALKVLVKDTEKELKKRRQSDALVCVTVTKPHSGTGIEPHSGTGIEPHRVTATKPHSGTAEPHSVTGIEPHRVTATKPHSVTGPKPHSVTITKPHSAATTAEPHSITITKPHSLTTAKPHSVTVEPHSVTTEPHSAATTTEPHSVTVTKPHSITTKPYSVTAEPYSVTTTKPHSATTKPHSTTAEPHSVTVEPYSVTTKPHSATTTKPHSATTEPHRATTTKPYSATAEPHSITTAKPHSATTEPHSTTTKPHSVTVEPHSATTKPHSITPPQPHTPTPDPHTIWGTRDEDPERQCPICLGEIREPRTLERCRHSFCSGCIARALEVRTACPVCGRFYGVLVGNQPPDGRMMVTRDGMRPLPGYEGCGTIVIQYVFPPGVQGEEHPNPGVRYPGTTRVAYLPDCPEGNKVLGLFRKAFAQRLTFTVGTSMTTGRANVITWNDIHHKTSCTGGPQLFGYPDPTYLTRVQEELRAKGITED